MWPCRGVGGLVVEQAPHVQYKAIAAVDRVQILPVALCCMSSSLSLPPFLSTLQLSCPGKKLIMLIITLGLFPPYPMVDII